MSGKGGRQRESSRQDAARARTDVAPYLNGSLDHARIWSGVEPISVDHAPQRIISIANMRRSLMAAPDTQLLTQPLEATYEGVFFPALLLCSGWWERSSTRALADEIDWHNGVQHWLFSGFEQWGPSWDVNPEQVEQEQYLFGQMGEGDESESLTVIIAGSKIDDIQARLAKGERAFAIRATGTLCHRSQIRDVAGLQQQMTQWGKGFDYCLIIYADEASHRVVPVDEKPRLYSGYIWQCVMPRSLAVYTEDEDSGGMVLQSPRLQDVYFLWEHTNLAKPDATHYNLDSLTRKREYVEREFGALITLQKSMHFIDGDCALPRERFYDFVRGASPNNEAAQR